ncbi:MAG TPA: amino acid ABC transporter permease [Ornithinimicrobium sp.]|uniref:amino acid ABC transporter permease n=1 Tax=Ornithinimicrobium sp. TaxID=1977084 RepID=UPI002B4941F6|nr:amino acid ABC transporter permease [Ornithinimicrobium sp.]HKJ12527.1 amino acid ABC transporter permease [Ornithinimicrobium sp.]
MSAQDVLFDVPGPQARVRHRILAVVGVLALLAMIAFILLQMDEKGQLAANKWTSLFEAAAWTNYLLPGIWDLVRAAVVAIVLSMGLGLMLAMGRMSDLLPVRWATTVFVEFFRAVPVLIMMIFTFFYLANQEWSNDSWNPFIGVVVGLTLYNSSVLCEVIRSGVGSLPNGQREAGLSIGLSNAQVRRSILVPQALTSMLPTIVSQIIVIVKDSALGYIILYPELLTQARNLSSSRGNVLQAYILAAVIFILINYALSKLAEAIENRQRRKAAGQSKKAKQDEGEGEEGGMAGYSDKTMEQNRQT